MSLDALCRASRHLGSNTSVQQPRVTSLIATLSPVNHPQAAPTATIWLIRTQTTREPAFTWPQQGRIPAQSYRAGWASYGRQGRRRGGSCVRGRYEGAMRGRRGESRRRGAEEGREKGERKRDDNAEETPNYIFTYLYTLILHVVYTSLYSTY